MRTIMNLRSVSAAMALALGSLALSSCFSSSEVQSGSESVGQQLQDLDHAYRQGIITEKEYAKLKKALIKKHG